MRTRNCPMTPLAAVAAPRPALGRLHGHGPICEVPPRRRSGRSARVGVRAGRRLEKAPDPGQIGKRLVEGFTQRELPDRWAWLTSTVAHWAYGSSAAALYGIGAGSLRRPRAWYGVPFGAAVWAAGYVVLPAAGLYKPIWEYDSKTLASDLSAHLAYGAGTGVTFWLLANTSSVAAWRSPPGDDSCSPPSMS